MGFLNSLIDFLMYAVPLVGLLYWLGRTRFLEGYREGFEDAWRVSEVRHNYGNDYGVEWCPKCDCPAKYFGEALSYRIQCSQCQESLAGVYLAGDQQELNEVRMAWYKGRRGQNVVPFSQG